MTRISLDQYAKPPKYAARRHDAGCSGCAGLGRINSNGAGAARAFRPQAEHSVHHGRRRWLSPWRGMVISQITEAGLPVAYHTAHRRFISRIGGRHRQVISCAVDADLRLDRILHRL